MVYFSQNSIIIIVLQKIVSTTTKFHNLDNLFLAHNSFSHGATLCDPGDSHFIRDKIGW